MILLVSAALLLSSLAHLICALSSQLPLIHSSTNADLIVGGHRVDPPFKYGGWMAALMINGVQYCGGSLIGPRHLITAAHCSERLTLGGRMKEVTVQFHRFDLSKTEREENAFEFRVNHPRFDNTNDGYLSNDLAIWELEKSPTVLWNNHNSSADANSAPELEPIALVEDAASDAPAGRFATVIGWGRTRRYDYSDRLKQLRLPIWQWEECAQEYGLRRGGFHRGMMCAGGRPDRDACNGDSGGPLIVERFHRSGQRKPLLVGLVSWGLLCGVEGLPGIYTNITYYLPWIRSILRPSQQ